MRKTTTALTKTATKTKSSNPKPRTSVNALAKDNRVAKPRAKVPSATDAPAKPKCDQVLQLLRRNNGASLIELQKATGWQAHSVRGFLSGTVKKRMGLSVTSVKPDGGERRYLIGKA